MSTSGFLVGLFLVAGVARARFDRPAPARSETTASWYYFGLAIYVAAFLLPYSVAAAYSALRLPGWGLPLLLAVLVAMVAPRVPPLSWADAWLRRQLRDLVGAPTAAWRLADELLAADFRPGDEVQGEVRALLKRRGYDPDERWLPPAEPMRALWLKAAVLFQQVRDWDRDEEYRDFVQGTSHEFDRLRARFDHLSLKVVRALRTVDRLGALYCELAAPVSGAPPAAGARAAGDRDRDVKAIVDEVLGDAADDVVSFLRELCHYVSRGVLAATLTSGGRLRRFASLGFALDRPRRSIPSLLAWAFLAYLTLFVGFMVAPQLLPGAAAAAPMSGGEWSMRILMIVTIQVAALAVAILPKELVGFANEDFRGRPPLAFIAGAGLAAVAAGGALQFVFFLLTSEADAARALEAWRQSAPWLLTALATASTAAFLVQDSRWSAVRSWRRRRLLDAAAMALALALAVQAAVALGAPSRLEPHWRLVLSLLIGVVIGGTVPGARRRHFAEAPLARPPRRRPAVDAAPTASAAPPSASAPIGERAAAARSPRPRPAAGPALAGSAAAAAGTAPVAHGAGEPK
jgi:hypothetical protein